MSEALPGEVVETCALCNVAGGAHDTRCPLSTDPERARFARIKVDSGDGHVSFPIVEQVPGGWQSGANHYPQSVVAQVWPLHLVEENR